MTRFVPLLSAQCADTPLLLSFIDKLRTWSGRGSLDREEATLVLKQVARLAIANFELRQTPKSETNTLDCPGSYSQPSILWGVFGLIEQLDLTDQYPILFDRISTVAADLNGDVKAVFRLLSHLLELSKTGSFDEHMPAFRTMFVKTMLSFVDNAITKRPRPPEQILPARVGCGCRYCTALDQFLADRTQKAVNFKESAYERTHLLSRLELIQTRNLLYWNWQMQGAGPVDLKITKTDGHFEHHHWAVAREIVRTQLSIVGSWAELEPILGDSAVEILCTTKAIPNRRFPGRLPGNLALPIEPHRTNIWMRDCLVHDPDSTVAQAELWDVYSHMMACGPSFSFSVPTLSPTEFFDALHTIPGVTATNENGWYEFRGIRVWDRIKDGDVASTSTHATNGTSAARTPLAPVLNTPGPLAIQQSNQKDTQSTVNPLKRKIEVVDLSDSS
jgi:hypothetical protein